ncbi:T9SS type A sorting domain-containing protein [Botryobacter ruber]|uniref:T9SS type A sorting domain-containing protein n=1 Tax=Botryobacter ruber TaxID=2171629 RepID=UPI000E0B04B4|nr:T9SS type A sorting domain-containing protein [Botryobacter ruber]
MKALILGIFCFFLILRVWAQPGCTDPQAQNFSADATENDGSCTYAAAAAELTNRKELPSLLSESSGLLYTDGKLWTLNDSGGEAAIYRISETDGSVEQVVYLADAKNKDWESITADEDYIYIGDFGNNSKGNRSNLRVYRVSKAALGAAAETTVTADIIYFTYQDQEDLEPADNNNTDFDCEAFLVKNNIVHLFTKEWISPHNTRHYTFPATPGTHVAVPVEELAADGLITGASLSDNNEIVLVGYTSNKLSLFMWLLFDYQEDRFFSGNKRRIALGSALQGQVEGVTFTTNGNGYVSTERISSPFGTVPPRLYSFSVAGFVNSIPTPALKVRPVPLAKGKALHVELSNTQETASTITLIGADGKVYLLKNVAAAAGINEQLQLDHLNSGVYFLRVTNSLETYTTKVLLQ